MSEAIRTLSPILGNSPTVEEHEPEIELTVSITLFRGSAEPKYRLDFVLGCTPTFSECHTEIDLGLMLGICFLCEGR